MNKNKQFFKLTVLSLTILTSMPTFAVQDVYEYQNKEGVTEFTDQVNDNKKLEKHIQIPKTTPEQEAQGKEKLDGIMAKDKELDKRLAKERKLENDRLKREAQARADKKQSEPESDNYSRRRNSNGDWYYPPVRPVHPIERPKPGKPVHKPGKPKVRAKAGGLR